MFAYISPPLCSPRASIGCVNRLWESEPTIFALEFVRGLTGIIATTIRTTVLVHLVSVNVV